jgi:hypothetical protein
MYDPAHLPISFSQLYYTSKGASNETLAVTYFSHALIDLPTIKVLRHNKAAKERMGSELKEQAIALR